MESSVVLQANARAAARPALLGCLPKHSKEERRTQTSLLVARNKRGKNNSNSHLVTAIQLRNAAYGKNSSSSEFRWARPSAVGRI